jgi:hypothetical protein
MDTVPRTAYLREKIGQLGQIFCTSEASSGDSSVVFNWYGYDQPWSAGSIKSIFLHTCYTSGGAQKTETFIVVNEYPPLSTEDFLKDQF